MKKALCLLIALIFTLSAAALSEQPAYSVNGSVLTFDIDNDGASEEIELTSSKDENNAYVTLNISQNGVLISHFVIASYSLSLNATILDEIKLCPLSVSGANRLFIETHAMGSENVYSSWMVVSFENNTIKILAYVSDPGFSSAYGLYEGNDPVDSQSFLLYYSDFGAYSEGAYLSTLDSRFSPYGLKFKLSDMPFGWYKAAGIDEELSGVKAALTTGYESLATSLHQSEHTEASVSYGTIEITGATVYLRSGAGTGYQQLLVLKKGDRLTYLNRTELDNRNVAWHYVTNGVTTGWVSSKYAKNPLVDSLIPANFKNTVLTTASLNFRDGASTSAYSIGTLNAGVSLEFLGVISFDERGVAWYKVRHNYTEGWISGKYSKLV